MPETKKKMLITGISGLLGNNLAYYFKNKYTVLGVYNSHPVVIEDVWTEKADIFSEVSFKKIVNDFDPDVLIHCAALANIDLCESDHEFADRINVYGTRIVAESIRGKKTKMVYISSDSVYEGNKGNFSEKDQVNPQNYYGLSKYKGELESLNAKNSLILRTNFFGWNIQKKFSIAEWILHELSNSKQIKGFRDVFFSSIYTFDWAKILDTAIDHDLVGVFNCGCSTSLSKYEFALRIAGHFGLDESLIQPISIDNFKVQAKRGKNLTLDVNELKKALSYDLPLINESIGAFCRDYNNDLPRKIKECHINNAVRFEEGL